MEENYQRLIKDKILRLIEERNTNIFQLSSYIDISDASIRNWYSKRNYNPSLDSVCKICEYFDIPLSQFFITENESSYPVDVKTKKFLDKYNCLNQKQKDIVNSIVDSYMEK